MYILYFHIYLFLLIKFFFRIIFLYSSYCVFYPLPILLSMNSLNFIYFTFQMTESRIILDFEMRIIFHS